MSNKKIWGRLAISGLIGVGLLSAPGWCDTIHLKNGRILVAHDVRVDGEDVVYETADGRKSIAASNVDHIVKSTSVSTKVVPRYKAPKLLSEAASETGAGPRKAKSDKSVEVLYSKPAPPVAAPEPNPSAEDFSLPDEAGKSVSLSSYRGRPVVLDFWATWCGPCRESMPVLQKLHEKYGARGLAVIGVNIEGLDEMVSKYIRDGKYTFKFLFDSGNFLSKVAKQYKVNGIPRAFLVDKTGRLRYSGAPQRLSAQLIEQALAE